MITLNQRVHSSSLCAPTIEINNLAQTGLAQLSTWVTLRVTHRNANEASGG